MSRDKFVLMMGTSPEGKGGVASVVSVYMEHDLFKRFPIRYVTTHREGSLLLKAGTGIFAALKVLLLLATGRVALVHAHTASNGSFIRKSAYLAIARAFGVPTVFHLHGAQFHKFADEAASPLMRRWIVETIARSTRVVALSQAWGDYLQRLAVEARVEVIANPVSLPVLNGPFQVESCRILFLGRADQRKGVFVLLEALALLKPRWPQLRLAIGGDGNLEQVRSVAAKHGLGEMVEILGWVSAEEKRHQFSRAQIFVLPSYDEGLPMAMLEAMAQAKPIVVTPVGGIPEAVQHERHGLLVPAGDAHALAVALEHLLESPDLRERIGSGARERVAERFSTDVVLRQVGEMYEALGVRMRSSE